MKKLIFLMLSMCLLLISGVHATLDSCMDNAIINEPCQIMTPDLVCTNYTYLIMENTGQIRETGNLTYLNESIYAFNFTLGEGGYIIKLCDKSTREIKVIEDDMMIWIIFVVFAIGILLTITSKILKNRWIMLFAGSWFFLSAITGSFYQSMFGWWAILFFALLGIGIMLHTYASWDGEQKDEYDD